MTKRDKKRLHEIYQKHYGQDKKKKKSAKENVEQKAKKEQKAILEKKGQSRADLMAQAKEKGIKNFRVLNKEELLKVVDPKTTEAIIGEVVQGAVARWKSGWGNKGRHSAVKKA